MFLWIGDGAANVALLQAILRQQHAQARTSQPFDDMFGVLFGLQMLAMRRFPVAWLQRSFKSDVCKVFCYFLQLCVQVRLSIGDGAPHVALL